MNCNFCEFKCDLGDNRLGLCKMYREEDGVVKEVNKNKWAICASINMERIPFYHYYPENTAMQVGGFNCNASCTYCINARIAINPENEIEPFVMTPYQIVERTKKSGLFIIHFGVNEVTVNLPSAIKVAKHAHENNLKVGVSTNGFMTEEACQLMIENFDFFNVSLKSISTDFYKKEMGLFSVEPILRNIREIAKSRHIEITTPIVANKNQDEILKIADFISSIDKNIVWHVFRLVEENLSTAEDVPDVAFVAEAVEKAREKLNYIYFGNFIGSNWVDTVCPNCKEVVIERLCDCACGARIIENRLKSNGICPNCGEKLSIVM